jgi:hypothetical protein
LRLRKNVVSPGAKSTKRATDFPPENIFVEMSRTARGLRLRCEGAIQAPEREENMKYILLMSGVRAGVDTYRAWSKADMDAHMAVLRSINKELSQSGEFVATQGLTGPEEAKVVRGEKDGMPVTDGVFPESKEFLLGYWIIDVQTPGRAYEIAGRISSARGPGGRPTNMPIEVRRLADRAPNAE